MVYSIYPSSEIFASDLDRTVTFGKAISIAQNGVSKPSQNQGYYPTHTQFIHSMTSFAKNMNLDIQDSLHEYQKSELKAIFTSKKYGRFYRGGIGSAGSLYLSSCTKMCRITRAPLAYGFLIDSNAVMEYMSNWIDSVQKDAFTTQQANPTRRYRQDNAFGVAPIFTKDILDYVEYDGERHNGASEVRKDLATVEGDLAVVFGVDEKLRDLVVNNPIYNVDAIPTSSYVTGIGYSDEALVVALPMIADFFNKKVTGTYLRSENLGRTTPVLDIVTSRKGYDLARELFYDLAGENTLAWIIMAERYGITITELREIVAIASNPSAVSNFIDKGFSFNISAQMDSSDIDPSLVDTMING